MPILSIIITVYNLESYIEDCLKSVLNQNITDYEIVLVDNGSTDRSVEICEDYAKSYSQIRFFKLGGKSIIGRAHRKGVIEAKGQYIHMVDGDDYVARDCYKNIINIICKEEPDVIIGGFISRPEKGAGNINDAIIEADAINKTDYGLALQYLMNVPNFHTVAWRYIYKKRLFPSKMLSTFKTKSIPSNAYGDALSTVFLLTQADSIYYYDKPFYYYRIRARGSVTSTMTSDHYLDFFVTGVVLLNYITTQHLVGIRKRFALERAKILFKLFSSGIDIISDAELSKLAQVLDKHYTILYLFSEIENSEMQKLGALIERYGSLEGLSRHFSNQRNNLLEKLKDKEDKQIYIFPTGYYSECCARIIKNYGINVAGFLDNDRHKDGKEIMDIKCVHPDIIRGFNKSKIREIVAVISTIYDKLRPILRDQLLEMGLSEEQIIIKE